MIKMDYYAVTLLLYILPKIRDCQSKCSDGFPHGEVTWSKWWCTPDSMCSYSCDEGYEKTDPNSDFVYCNLYGEWKTSFGSWGKDPCRPKSCPNQIPNGELPNQFLCPGTVGSTCEYSCYVGYQKKVGVPSIACLPSTKWSSDLHSLCTNQHQCSYEVAYGDLEMPCRRMPGETCKFTCHEDYIPSTAVPSREITCGPSQNWSQPLSSLCKSLPTTTTTAAPTPCPTIISNGYISNWCDRAPRSKCNYNCNEGCYKNYSALNCSRIGYCTLECSIHGYWRDEKYACICEDPESSDKIAYVVGICAGVAFPVATCIIFFCFGVRCKRLNQERGCNNHVSRRAQTSLQQPNYAEREAHRPPPQPQPQLLAPRAEQSQTADNTPIADEPPQYNSIAIAIPGDAPPPYEQVICNPSKFKM